MRASDFWALSLTEWRAAVSGFAECRGARAKPSPMGRAELQSLMQRFPD